ncbi:hypothetical protein A4S06_01920 [Erysipelotrichaceae bacterium MTC7]|nr:hypothetical protein A4S06_01920 [Erysipelotrichaceae bacterium MTC7]
MERKTIIEIHDFQEESFANGVRIMQPFYEKENISFMELKVLKMIIVTDHMTLNVLAKQLNKAATNTSVMVKRMEQKGLLTKTVSSTDKRILFLSPTKKGKQLLYDSINHFAKIAVNDKKFEESLEQLHQALANYNKELARIFTKTT